MMEWLLIALVQTAAGDPNTTTSPAPAAETETTQTTQSAAQEERVCRRVYNTGSRLRYTWDCGRTAAEDNRREEEQQDLHRFQSRVRPPTEGFDVPGLN